MRKRGVVDCEKEGLTVLECVVKQNNTDAELMLAEAYKGGSFGFPRDEAQGIHWLRKAAENNSQAEGYPGYAYSHGEGVPKDGAEEVKWYEKAAEQGNVNGQAKLGYMNNNVKGGVKDRTAAAKRCHDGTRQGEP